MSFLVIISLLLWSYRKNSARISQLLPSPFQWHCHIYLCTSTWKSLAEKRPFYFWLFCKTFVQNSSILFLLIPEFLLPSHWNMHWLKVSHIMITFFINQEFLTKHTSIIIHTFAIKRSKILSTFLDFPFFFNCWNTSNSSSSLYNIPVLDKLSTFQAARCYSLL